MSTSIQIIYNSVCPVCREGICYFERKTPPMHETSTSASIDYFDLSAEPNAFVGQGVTLDDVRLKLHAALPDGRIVRGWPAVSALWRVVPGYRWLATLGDLPVLNWGARALYHLAAHMLWHWNRISGRW